MDRLFKDLIRKLKRIPPRVLTGIFMIALVAFGLTILEVRVGRDLLPAISAWFLGTRVSLDYWWLSEAMKTVALVICLMNLWANMTSSRNPLKLIAGVLLLVMLTALVSVPTTSETSLLTIVWYFGMSLYLLADSKTQVSRRRHATQNR